MSGSSWQDSGRHRAGGGEMKRKRTQIEIGDNLKQVLIMVLFVVAMIVIGYFEK